MEQRSNQVSEVMRDLLLTVIIGFLIGLIMAAVSNIFVAGIAWLTQARESLVLPINMGGSQSYNLMPIVSLLIAAFAIVYLRKKLSLPRFFGPADSIYAAHRTDNELNVKYGLGSTLAAFVAAGGGASVGQYGPLVHFGATMGSYFRQTTKSTMSTDIFIGCGVAGAIAAGFNAPLAGVIFALEAIIRHFSVRAVAPITIASFTAAAASQTLLGDRYLIRISAPEIDLVTMLPPAFLTGPVFGLVAVSFMFLIRYVTRKNAASGLSVLQSALLGAVLCGGIGVFVPEILGLGSDTVRSILSGEGDASYLALLVIVKLVATAICLGFGLFGGVFSPAIFIGAAAGGALAVLFGDYGGASLATVLAVTGMGAVVAPVIGAPIAVILVILEFTQSYDMAVLGMIGIVISSWVAHIFYGASFFDRLLLDRGIDLHRGRGHLNLMETPLAAYVHQDYTVFGPRVTVGKAISTMQKDGRVEAYIVDRSGHYVGKLDYLGLIKADPKQPVSQCLQGDALSIKGDASLLQAIEAARDFVGESIPVVDRESGALDGIVTEGDLFSAYLDLQNRVVDIEGK